MIKTVKISNFKSVQELEIELGRVNVFIGENGCGKTSILEGIAMGSAAAVDKLDEAFLVTRGIRMVEEALMMSAFKQISNNDEIRVEFNEQEVFPIEYSRPNDGDIVGEWIAPRSEGHNFIFGYIGGQQEALRFFANYTDDDIDKAIIIEKIEHRLQELREKLKTTVPLPELGTFLLYAPENFFLRRFEEEGQIRPLGYRGEGLFRHLVELSKEAPETFAKIAENLSLIDWFGGMSIPTNLQFTERRIAITDRFIADTIAEFDQRSANEGFLYLLFYFTLFLSKYTPKFFAIDNIDNALNPRLCAKLVEVLVKIAKDEDKQCILTTHNPAVLDGLDLKDDEQRLFVIYRNADGETKARRVKAMVDVPGTQPVRLSEAFVRGYLGGLPANF